MENFLKDKKFKDMVLNFKHTIMLHGGGWKKLEDKKINNSIFKNEIKKILNIDFIINYYGMIEQTGSIFFECEKCNNFVTSIYSDIIIRDAYLNDARFQQKRYDTASICFTYKLSWSQYSYRRLRYDFGRG